MLTTACVAALSVMAIAQNVVGPALDTPGGMIVPTGQRIRPTGLSTEFPRRPIDLALSPDGTLLAAKDNKGVTFFDAATLTERGFVEFGQDGPSMVGMAFSAAGDALFATNCRNDLVELRPGDNGAWAISRRLRLPGPKGSGDAFPCGVAVSGDGRTALVCLSRNNSLGVVDLADGKLVREIEVGIAPYAVARTSDGTKAFVTNWGGRRPAPGEATADSSGTRVLIDARGISASGSVSIVDLAGGREVANIETGLSACGLLLSTDEKTLYVANANSDTVSFVDVATRKVTQQYSTRPQSKLPFGSMPNGLCVLGETLYVTNAGNNSVAVIGLKDGGSAPTETKGFIPTGWYPGAVLADRSTLFIANIKGVGSRTPEPPRPGFNSHKHRGTVSRVPIPDASQLATLTAVAAEDARLPQILKAMERSATRQTASPIPSAPGDPSVISHVVYVIKENRTYDQVLGDMPRGNGDKSLCVYGRDVTPNQHALAEQFVLLDNFYCNGVLSADGHSWVTEGNVTPYLERSFGGFKRSYTFGDDPLTYSSSGFVWDHVLAAGFSFRNYGEFDDAGTEPGSKYKAVYEDMLAGGQRIKFTHNIGVENVRKYTHPVYPGWNLDIPDQVRANIFLEELARYEKGELGDLPNFITIYLPNDHTAGVSKDVPTPRSYVADNDRALGRMVEALSHSRFWSSMCVFVVEDDPQDGWDHVDGHRSVCQVLSPYTRRGAVVSTFYNQASVVHSIERIFGLTAANQAYAAAPLMSDCFGTTADPTPFNHITGEVPLCEFKAAAGNPERMELERRTAAMDFSKPDLIKEDAMNRVLWKDARGSVAYPSALAGAHGKGLKALGLKLDPRGDVEDDD